jgi:hypothetical protein
MRAFGLDLLPDFEAPGLHPTDEPTGDPVRMRLVERSEIARRWSSAGSKVIWTTLIDGSEVSVERGRAGDHRFSYGEHAEFWLSEGTRDLLCAPTQPRRAEWLRFLLDTVLTVTSLLRGFEGLHASAVVRDGSVIALIGNTGGGKTSLALELVRRGATLFCDDILVLRRRLGSVVAYPGPALMNVPLSQLPVEDARTLARLGDEAWVELSHAPPQSAGLAAIFHLERAAGAPDRIAALPSSPLPLLPHTLAIAPPRERTRTRFELIADLAFRTPVFRAEAELATTPSALADMVECTLEGSSRALSEAPA